MGRFADDMLMTAGEVIDQISVASDKERASSTSTPRYLTVFSILLWPSRIRESSGACLLSISGFWKADSLETTPKTQVLPTPFRSFRRPPEKTESGLGIARYSKIAMSHQSQSISVLTNCQRLSDTE